MASEPLALSCTHSAERVVAVAVAIFSLNLTPFVDLQRLTFKKKKKGNLKALLNLGAFC